MTDSNLDEGQRRPGRSHKPTIHDWRLRRDAAEAAVAEIKWPQLLAFDSVVRERLTAILVRRAAERAAEQGLSRDVRAKLWRARLETRRQEFADALDLSVSAPFSLDLISHPGPGRNGQTLFSAGDIEAAFSPDTATGFATPSARRWSWPSPILKSSARRAVAA
jgi:hypothetical protein